MPFVLEGRTQKPSQSELIFLCAIRPVQAGSSHLCGEDEFTPWRRGPISQYGRSRATRLDSYGFGAVSDGVYGLTLLGVVQSSREESATFLLLFPDFLCSSLPETRDVQPVAMGTCADPY